MSTVAVALVLSVAFARRVAVGAEGLGDAVDEGGSRLAGVARNAAGDSDADAFHTRTRKSQALVIGSGGGRQQRLQ